MRKSYLWIAMISLLTACKKETITTKEVEAKDPPAIMSTIVGPPPVICSGNHWSYDNVFYPDWYYQPRHYVGAPPLVYNNKIYIPDFDDQEVRIYDGNNWQHLPSNVPITTVFGGMSFTIGNKGYIGETVPGGEFWQYNFATNNWTRKADFPGHHRLEPTTFSIGSNGYVACGYNDIVPDGPLKDLWEYNQASNTWTKKADMPIAFSGATGFNIGNKGYIVNGKGNLNYHSSLLEYDPGTNSWSYKAAFPGAKRAASVAFVISGQAYVGGGGTGTSVFMDYYKYDPGADSWLHVAGLPFFYEVKSVYGFSLNSVGYTVCDLGDSDPDIYTYKYTPLTCPN